MAQRNQSLRKFSTLDPPEKCTWCVYAYILNKDIFNTPPANAMYGGIFCLGSFSSRDKAEKHAKHVMSITEHSGIVVAKYAHFIPLTMNYNSTAVERVLVDEQGNVQEIEDANYRQEKKHYEEEEERRAKLIARQTAESQPDSLEYFQQQLFLACTAQAQIEQAQATINDLQRRQSTQLQNARDSLAKNPQYREQWLPKLQEHCQELGQQSQYESIAAIYDRVISSLL